LCQQRENGAMWQVLEAMARAQSISGRPIDAGSA